MTAIEARFGVPGHALRISYTPAAPLVGGQLVERRPGVRQVGPAAAGSTHVVGVALDDALAAKTYPLQIGVGDELGLAVIRRAVVPVIYAAPANAGDKLIAAANGQVTPAAAGADPATVVGECFDTAAAGAEALAYIF